MKRCLSAVSLLLAFGILVSCGGTGAPGRAVGAWTGVITDSNQDQVGTLTILVQPDDLGTVSGSATDVAGPASGVNVSGSLSRNMNLELTCWYPGGQVTGTGTVSAANGILAGYIDITRPSQSAPQRLLITLIPQGVSGAGSPTLSPTAACTDGTISFSATCSGTCSHHGGVATWYRADCGKTQ